MVFIPLVVSKAILAFCNFLLLACGFSLITGGMLILFDTDRVLLSRLLTSGVLAQTPQPFLYYTAIGLASLGLIIASTGILGCWASCLHNYYMLTIVRGTTEKSIVAVPPLVFKSIRIVYGLLTLLNSYCFFFETLLITEKFKYFVVIVLLLISECAIYAISFFWSNCLGIGVDVTELVRTLQKNYGTVGQEQFTAAVDLAQTVFGCCGIESAVEYDTSLWRLQALGPSLAIPLTCCQLDNAHVAKAYLDPRPINSTLCQALEPGRHEGYRHLGGCQDHLARWYRDHYMVFLAIGLVAVLTQFMVLLSTILTCTRIYRHNLRTKARMRAAEEEVTRTKYVGRAAAGPRSVENIYTGGTSFRQNYKIVDKI